MKFHRYRGRALAVAALALAAVLAPISGTPAQAATAVRDAYWVSPQNDLHRLVNGQDVNLQVKVQAGGSPVAVHHRATGTTQAVFVAPDRRLRTYRAGTDSSLGGTSAFVSDLSTPAVASDGTNPVVAFRGTNGRLWVVGQDNLARDTGGLVEQDTSPAITVAGDWRWVLFVNQEDGLLWRFAWRESPSGPADASFEYVSAGFGMDRGSIPSISQNNGALRPFIAFRARGATRHLWWIDRNNVGHNTGIQLSASDDPVIVKLPNGQPLIAYRDGGNGLLYSLNPVTNVRQLIGNGLGVSAGSSPSLSAATTGSTGFVAAFSSNGGYTLWTVDESGHQIHYGFRIRIGSTPAVLAR